MVAKTISELTAAGTLGGTELFVITDGDGNSRKVTLAELKAFINTDPTVVPSSEPARGARANRTSNQSISASTQTVISWNEAFDLDGTAETESIWVLGAPTRLTVPAGVTVVELFGGIDTTATGSSTCTIIIIKNGEAFPGRAANGGTNTNSGSKTVTLGTGPIPAVEGDYFEISIFISAGSAIEANASSFFTMRIVEGTI